MSIKEGELVELTDNKNVFFLNLKSNEVFSTHKGNIYHNDIIGKEYGDTVKTHKGKEFLILKPTLYDIIMYGIKRKTQIIYPKDSAYITLKLGLTSDMKVFETGIGSGALTIVMANAVKPSGIIHAYEKEIKHLQTAKENLKLAQMDKYVHFHNKDISLGIEEKDFDAAFIDVKEPWTHIKHIKPALKKGAIIGFLVPTANQIINLLQELERHSFLKIEVKEILLREYKPIAERLRPEDRMVAHTGYLIFARNK
ncbi:MAG: tRNA (adenine-N1)-methyltransferase [Aquificae bacterium]|nr:tRNA (adenine-N1)-methyltransferase [Aquificota bacterium]